MPTINERVALLRAQLKKNNLDAWIINGTDPHQSEYVAPRWKSREWISGFSGSAGSVLVTADEALLWVDSRYFIQGEEQIAGTEFTLMRLDTPGYPDMNTYLKRKLKAGSRVGIAQEALTISARALYESAWAGSLTLVAMEDILDAIWADRPAVPSTPVIQVADDLAGFSAEQKLAMVRTALGQSGGDWTIIASLDDIAWLTNLRASDVSYNPVFYSYALVGRDKAFLFVDRSRFSDEILAKTEASFAIEPYEETTNVLKKVIKADDTIYLSPDRISLLIADAMASSHYITGRDFTTDLKASKNETELEGMRRAHLLDGVALVNFLSSLDRVGGTYTEIEIAAMLARERERSSEYLGPSFGPISGWAEHGALPHYSATEESNATVTGDGLLVLDTGGHYQSGMTDVTRTILFGEATEQQKRDYTLVLKGNLALAGCRFPEGTNGYQLDVLARQFLWQEGLAFHHGTGHGIGFRLNVHEGPQSISPRPLAVPLKKGMIISDEPGLYRQGSHGIRIENIVAVQEDVKSEFGQFLSFEVLTICPFERTLIVKELLTETEVAMVDAYHRWVREELKDLVDERALPYLEAATSPYDKEHTPMVTALKKMGKISRKGPVVLIIMDGVGFGKYKDGDGVAAAMTGTLDKLYSENPWTKLKAHGQAVGLPSDDDMGNSEVGHNAIGCGRVFSQGAKLVGNSISSRAMFDGEVWKRLVANTKEHDSTMHFIGLLSDGNVHSHIDNLKAMVAEAKAEGVKRVRIHALLDGRDVGELSALEYFLPFEAFLASLNDGNFDARIASGGGRMVITMDRYNANWNMVKRGWETHVLGEGRLFASAKEAIETLRGETGAIDQDLPPFVIAEGGKPVGTIEDGDSVILFNFRGDRALEITKAFEAETLDEFDRKRYPKVQYAGMMEYDGDLHVPRQYLVSPPAIDRTMAEYLCASNVRQFSISETQKFGHITYFFNGNRTGKFDEKLEEYVEIPSDIVPFEQRPWMKCAEIADRVIAEVESGKWDLIKLNFPNGDMVGHTGVFQAVVCSMEGMDLQIGRIAKAVKREGGVMIISADHGNADDMFEHAKDGSLLCKENGEVRAKTSHSLNPVPCIIVDYGYNGEYSQTLNEGLGISSLAATVMNFLDFEAPADYDKSVITVD